MSKFLAPPGLQHARLPCPSLISRVCSNSCPLSWWCHPTISSSAAPFSFYLQSLPASGSFPMSCLFTSDSQSIGASASASVFSMSLFNQPWIGLISFRIDWLDWSPIEGLISLLSKGLWRVFSSTTFESISSLLSLFYGPTFTSIHDYWKNHSFDYSNLCWQSDVSSF